MARSTKGRTPGGVKLYGGNHGKSGKIGEGYGIFGWPLRLRHEHSIIPGEHRTSADRPLPFILLHAKHIQVHFDLSRMLKSSWYGFSHAYVFLRKYTHLSKNVPFFLIFALHLLRYHFWLRIILS